MLRAPHARRWSAVTAACALLIWAGTLIVRRAYSDARARSSQTLAELERACSLDLQRASCWARLAEAREALGEDGFAAWQQSLTLNPRDASVLVQAALSAESRGDLHTAERLLVQATVYNHLWLTRWTLANFYFRHSHPEFWTAMRSALERSHGDPTAAFRLCRDAGAGAAEMLDRVLPQVPEMYEAFVRFLISEGAIDDLPAAAERYAKQATPAARGSVASALTAAVHMLLAAGRAQEALTIWNDLAVRGYIPYPAWSAEVPLVNGKFDPPLSTPAFDWRAPRSEDISPNFGTPPGGVKISLSGRQPEDAEILSQFLLLRPRSRYLLSFDYQTPGITADESALYWTILQTRSETLASSTWQRISVRFEIPAGEQPSLAKLALVAGRKHGHARMQGEVWIRHMRLEAY
jgi:hypothetical protein